MVRINQGFTLVELIAVLVIAGVLAFVAIPRMVGTSTFEQRGFSDTVVTALHYAQKTAIAQHTSVTVCISPTTISAAYTTGCTAMFVSNADNTALSFTTPSGTTITTTPATSSFIFAASGSPSIATNLTIQLSGETARTIIIEAGTGYARRV